VALGVEAAVGVDGEGRRLAPPVGVLALDVRYTGAGGLGGRNVRQLCRRWPSAYA
jgi:hypothetical protein